VVAGVRGREGKKVTSKGGNEEEGEKKKKSKRKERTAGNDVTESFYIIQ